MRRSITGRVGGAVAALAAAVTAATAGATAAAAQQPAAQQPAAQQPAAPAADSGARRAVGALVTRSDAFRDTVNRALGAMDFDYGERRASRVWRRFASGLTLTVTQPVGEFRNFARPGFGLSANGVAGLDRAGVFGLRVEGGGANYGQFSAALPQNGLLLGIPARQVTSNNMYWGSVGPQLTLPLGPVRPYGFATVGIVNFTTTSRLQGASPIDGSSQTFWTANDAWNLSTATGWGGGLRFEVARQQGTPLHLDLGARRQVVNSARYFSPGAGVPGQVPLEVLTRVGRADFVAYHVGFSVGGR